MFSQKFSNITSSDPNTADAIKRVASYFAEAEADDANIARMKLDSNRLKEITQSPNLSALTEVISLLVSEHLFQRTISLESPLGGGIAEYTSLADIPSQIRDIKQDAVIDVTPALIKVFYIPILQND